LAKPAVLGAAKAATMVDGLAGEWAACSASCWVVLTVAWTEVSLAVRLDDVMAACWAACSASYWAVLTAALTDGALAARSAGDLAAP
jgi:hypothetical protein